VCVSSARPKPRQLSASDRQGFLRKENDSSLVLSAVLERLPWFVGSCPSVTLEISFSLTVSDPPALPSSTTRARERYYHGSTVTAVPTAIAPPFSVSGRSVWNLWLSVGPMVRYIHPPVYSLFDKAWVVDNPRSYCGLGGLFICQSAYAYLPSCPAG
jgi:hypothetical protein